MRSLVFQLLFGSAMIAGAFGCSGGGGPEHDATSTDGDADGDPDANPIEDGGDGDSDRDGDPDVVDSDPDHGDTEAIDSDADDDGDGGVEPEPVGFDETANDTCATAQPIDQDAYGRGSLDPETDVDWFCSVVRSPGTIQVELRHSRYLGRDFQIELFEECAAGPVATGTVTGDARELSGRFDGDDPFCLRVTAIAGSGPYRLLVWNVRELPTVDSMTPASGEVGDVVTFTGTSFGTSSDAVFVDFNGSLATIESVTGDELRVRVPAQGFSGLVNVNIAGKVAPAGEFTYDPEPDRVDSSWTAPPPSTLIEGTHGEQVYGSHSRVAFEGHMVRSEMEAVLDDFVDSYSPIAGYEIVGFLAFANAAQVEWDWGDMAPTVPDYVDLVRATSTLPGVVAVEPEAVVTTSDIGFATDVHTAGEYDATAWDLNAGLAAINATYRQLGVEEAWRLYRYRDTNPLTDSRNGVTIAVLDSGLEAGEYSAGAGEEFPSPSRSPSFELLKNNPRNGAWTGSSVTDDTARHFIKCSSHGTSVVGILAARNQRLTPLAGGSEHPVQMNGVLTGFDQLGIDDDGDGLTDWDDTDGESVSFTAFVYDVAWGGGHVPLDCRDWSTDLILSALHDTRIQGGGIRVINGSFSMSTAGLGSDVRTLLSDALRSLDPDTLLVIAAGNDNASAYRTNAYARYAYDLRRGSTLVVGGTHTRSPDLRADYSPDHGSNWGEAVDVAAPYDWWNTTEFDDDTTVRRFSNGTNAMGTSLATPSVTATVAFLRAVAPIGTPVQIKDILLDESTDISSRWDHGAMLRVDVAAAVLRAVGPPDPNLYVYSLDYDPDTGEPPVLWSAVVDPSTGEPDMAHERHSRNLGDDGCVDGVDVEVDPRGDVVYVLCSDGGTGIDLFAYRAGTLDYVGASAVRDLVWGTGVDEMVVTPDGIIHVPIADGSSLRVVGIDGFAGAVAAPELVIPSSRAGEIRGASMSRMDAWAVGISTGAAGEDDDAIYRFGPLPLLDRIYDAPSMYDFAGLTETVDLRDVEWTSDGDVLGVFHSTAGRREVALVRGDMSGADAFDVHYAEELLSVASDPSGRTTMAYVGGRGGLFADGSDAVGLHMIDVSFTAEHIEPVADFQFGFDRLDSIPLVTRFADNGRFVVVGWQGGVSSPGRSMVASFAHDASRSGLYEGPADGDIWSRALHDGWLDRCQAVAITPTVSVLAPRPGTVLDHIRRLLIQVRDPEVTHLEISTDDGSGAETPVPGCESVVVHGGIADDCVYDWFSIIPVHSTFLVRVRAFDATGATGTVLTVWYQQP